MKNILKNAIIPMMLEEALAATASEGYFELVKWLVTNGADVSKKDHDGKTALKIAKEKKFSNIVKHLIPFKVQDDSDSEEETELDRNVGKRMKGGVSYLSKKSSISKMRR